MNVTLVQINLTGGVSTSYYHVQVFGLARRLAQNGCSVTVITADRNPSSRGAGFHEVEQDGYRVVYLPIRLTSCHQTIVSGLNDALARYHPDVVQVAELIELTTLQALLWCRCHCIPCVVWHGAYDYFGKAVGVQKAYIRSFGRLVSRSASAVIAKTTSAKVFVERLGADPTRVHAIPVGLDAAAFLAGEHHSEDASWIPSGPYLMNVGQMNLRKNQAVLIRALGLLRRWIPDLSLLIIGDGPEHGALADLAESLDLVDHVHLRRDRVPNTMLPQVYGGAFLTMMPSLYEIFGMTVLESFACGTPVIGRNTGGMTDLIAEGVNGLLYERDDEEFIADAVVRLYRDRDAYDALRQSTQASSRNWDWESIAPRFLRVYGSVSRSRGGSE